MFAHGVRRQRRQKPRDFCKITVPKDFSRKSKGKKNQSSGRLAKRKELILFEKRVISKSLFFHSKSGMGEDGIINRFQVSFGKTLFYLSHMLMSTPRVLLISSQRLFSESMETILRAEKEVEVIGPWNLGDRDICERLAEARPSVVVIADENLQSETAAELTKVIIERYSEISVIRAALNENVFRVFSTRTLPARGDNLLETIRTCITSIQESTGLDRP